VTVAREWRWCGGTAVRRCSGTARWLVCTDIYVLFPTLYIFTFLQFLQYPREFNLLCLSVAVICDYNCLAEAVNNYAVFPSRHNPGQTAWRLGLWRFTVLIIPASTYASFNIRGNKDSYVHTVDSFLKAQSSGAAVHDGWQQICQYASRLHREPRF
jgi:hypothetical protein